MEEEEKEDIEDHQRASLGGMNPMVIDEISNRYGNYQINLGIRPYGTGNIKHLKFNNNELRLSDDEDMGRESINH